jgi:hypothetical protein
VDDLHPFFKQDVQSIIDSLTSRPVVKRYQEAEEAMRRLVKKYFETNVMDYRNNNCPDGLVEDAAELAETYKELKLSATIKAMGGPAPM